jgi:hypothetical protein
MSLVANFLYFQFAYEGILAFKVVPGAAQRMG